MCCWPQSEKWKVKTENSNFLMWGWSQILSSGKLEYLSQISSLQHFFRSYFLRPRKILFISILYTERISRDCLDWVCGAAYMSEVADVNALPIKIINRMLTVFLLYFSNCISYVFLQLYFLFISPTVFLLYFFKCISLMEWAGRLTLVSDVQTLTRVSISRNSRREMAEIFLSRSWEVNFHILTSCHWIV